MTNYDDFMYHVKCFRKIRKHNLWELYYNTWDKYLQNFNINELGELCRWTMKLHLPENNYVFNYSLGVFGGN